MPIVQGDERCGLPWIMEDRMMTAWTRTLALGVLVCPLACVVSVNDDGAGGSFSSSGSSGSSSSGSAGDGGFGGSGGSSGSGGSGAEFPAPTCDAEPVDDNDLCVQCFKRNCCTEWLNCDDQSCTNEWLSVSECLEPRDFAGEDELGMCISEASEANDGFVQTNTQALIDCALTPADDAGLDTLCSSECFGSDIFYE
jgi:hypothetical protein